MLALTDAAFARLAIAATAIAPEQRERWLQEIAEKLDPPVVADNRSPAARRQARVRARRKNGMHHYGLWLSDLAVEGIVTQMVTTGQLSAAEADDPRYIEAMLARLLEEQGETWAREFRTHF
jgi:polyhydroxyalkanoate synthesis regulator phasin